MVILNILSNARLQAGWKKLVMLSVWIICEPFLAVAQSDIPRLDITEGQIEAVHETGIPVIQIYGATETAPFASTAPVAGFVEISSAPEQL